MALIPLTATVLLFFKKIYSLTTSPSFTYYQHILASSCSHCSLCWNCCQFTNDFYLTKLSEHCQSSQWVSDTTDHSFLASFLSWHLSLVSWLPDSSGYCSPFPARSTASTPPLEMSNHSSVSHQQVFPLWTISQGDFIRIYAAEPQWSLDCSQLCTGLSHLKHLKDTISKMTPFPLNLLSLLSYYSLNSGQKLGPR